VAELKHADDAAVTCGPPSGCAPGRPGRGISTANKLPLVHHARVGIEVKFRDFAALSDWVGEHVTNTGGSTSRTSSGH